MIPRDDRRKAESEDSERDATEPSQREVLIKIARTDPAARVLGLNQKRCPVVLAMSSGSGGERTWALLRNGQEAETVGEVVERWGDPLSDLTPRLGLRQRDTYSAPYPSADA